MSYCVFFFNDTATTEIYTLSLHDALPISRPAAAARVVLAARRAHGGPVAELLAHLAGRAVLVGEAGDTAAARRAVGRRSEEHTSELQSRQYLVCRLLLEKKKKR